VAGLIHHMAGCPKSACRLELGRLRRGMMLKMSAQATSMADALYNPGLITTTGAVGAPRNPVRSLVGYRRPTNEFGSTPPLASERALSAATPEGEINLMSLLTECVIDDHATEPGLQLNELSMLEGFPSAAEQPPLDQAWEGTSLPLLPSPEGAVAPIWDQLQASAAGSRLLGLNMDDLQPSGREIRLYPGPSSECKQ
jgi:hypothetical protein